MVKREDIKYRIGQVFKNADGSIKGASFLVYIDARTAFDGLDEKYGDNWSFDWEQVDRETCVHGRLTILKGDSKLVYGDVGYPNQTKIDGEGSGTGEWLKDAVSDSAKRCAIQAGVGRELYSAPFLYSKAEELNIKGNKVSSYNPLNQTGEQLIRGAIDKWYKGLSK